MKTQAIVVRYIGPRGTRGARLIARCIAGSVSIQYPHDSHHDDKPRVALRALLAKLDAACIARGHPPTWANARYAEGGMPDGKTTVFVQISE